MKSNPGAAARYDVEAIYYASGKAYLISSWPTKEMARLIARRCRETQPAAEKEFFGYQVTTRVAPDAIAL